MTVKAIAVTVVCCVMLLAAAAAARGQEPPQTVEGIRFSVDRCWRRSVEATSCAVMAEAQDGDKRLFVFGRANCKAGGSSFVVDSQGNQHQPTTLVLGSARNNGFVQTMAVQNVPVRTELTFGPVDKAVDRIAMLSLTFNNQGCNATGTKVIFRNIPLK